VWVYCKRGVFYVNHRNGFQRADKIGTLTLFTGSFDNMSYDPSLQLGAQNTPLRFKQLMLDTETGKIFKNNPRKFKKFLLSRDLELYNEFIQIKSSREQKLQIYNFVNKFNVKHPLF